MLMVLDAAPGAPASSVLLVQFLGFVIIGVLVGWALGRPPRLGAISPALAMIGVCGAAMGSDMTSLLVRVEDGTPQQLLGALAGALALAYAWRRLHPPSPVGDDHGVAIPGSRA